MSPSDLQAKWDSIESLKARLLELMLTTEPTREVKENLLRVLDTKQALTKKTNVELVDLALSHLSAHVTDSSYESVVEELCTRVDPDWTKRDIKED